jgi:hypothetical protein
MAIATNKQSQGYGAGSGLVVNGSNLDNTLITGAAGGQTVTGGTANADNLSLRPNAGGSSTGRIRIGNTGGTATLTILEGTANAFIGINNETPAATIDIKPGTNSSVNILCVNGGSGASTQLQLLNSGATTGMVLLSRSTAGTITGIASAGCGLSHFGTVGPLVVGTVGAADLAFPTNSVERMRIDSLGNVSIGSAALSTSATDGFLYVDTCAGTPTGVPTAKTGRVALVYDTANNKLAIYNGAWKQTVALT